MMTRRSLLLLGTTLAAAIGLGGSAHADSYAYSNQTLSNFTFAGPTPGALSFGGQNGATINGSGPAMSNSTNDVPQAYAGVGAPPPQNTFTPTNVGSGNYARGDSLVTPTPSFTTAAVGETYLSTIPFQSSGIGNWNVSAPITLTSAGTVTLSFNYVNNLFAQVTQPGGTASSSLSFSFTITPTNAPNSAPVFTASPTQVNRGVSVLTIGQQNFQDSGTVTITSASLAAGTYTATITGSARVFATVVPEPSSIAMAGAGLIGLAGLGLRRMRARGR